MQKLIAVLLATGIFSACSAELAPEAHLSVSTDNGGTFTYIDESETLPVGEPFYLKFEVSIKANPFKKIDVPFSIAIPSNGFFESTLTDIDGSVNKISIGNIDRYDFHAQASGNPEVNRVIFQGRAFGATTQRIRLTYGGNVSEEYAQDFTLSFTE